MANRFLAGDERIARQLRQGGFSTITICSGEHGKNLARDECRRLFCIIEQRPFELLMKRSVPAENELIPATQEGRAGATRTKLVFHVQAGDGEEMRGGLRGDDKELPRRILVFALLPAACSPRIAGFDLWRR